MRRTAFILLALALVAGVSAFALAQGPQHHGEDAGKGNQKQGGDRQCDRDCLSTRVVGVITMIDADNLVVEVETDDGLLTVQVTENTRIKMGREPATFEDLQVEQTITVCGYFDEDVLVAKLINIKYRGEVK